jgi:hypothetical protein
MSRADNDRRIENGARLMHTYSTTTEDSRDGVACLVDMLTDLRHWAHDEKVDFDLAIATSQMHFREEVK